MGSPSGLARINFLNLAQPAHLTWLEGQGGGIPCLTSVSQVYHLGKASSVEDVSVEHSNDGAWYLTGSSIQEPELKAHQLSQ